MNIKKEREETSSERSFMGEPIYVMQKLVPIKTCMLTYLCGKRMLKHTYVSFSSEARLAMLQYFVARFYLALCLGRQNIHPRQV